ncbi:hypothetical protein BJY59DRAFT_699143 [Rhodotorula toruloides]
MPVVEFARLIRPYCESPERFPRRKADIPESSLCDFDEVCGNIERSHAGQFPQCCADTPQSIRVAAREIQGDFFDEGSELWTKCEVREEAIGRRIAICGIPRRDRDTPIHRSDGEHVEASAYEAKAAEVAPTVVEVVRKERTDEVENFVGKAWCCAPADVVAAVIRVCVAVRV